MKSSRFDGITDLHLIRSILKSTSFAVDSAVKGSYLCPTFLVYSACWSWVIEKQRPLVAFLS